MIPISAAGMNALGWEDVDVVFVTGDAFVDHPSFATALLARVLEAEGLRVAVLAQPDWQTCDAWKTFGRPRLAFCISAGNMDSMINHYTAGRKVRNEDAYSPGGVIGKRPDRATLSYSQRAREAFPGVPVMIGGVEASLRRLSHYDYWSDKVRRSILFDSKADMLVYGMGEAPLLEIIRLLRDGRSLRNDADGRIAEPFRHIRGTAFRIGAREDLPEEEVQTSGGCLHLPSHEEVVDDHRLFAEMTRIVYENLQPQNAARLVQQHALEAVIVNPPTLPMTEKELDRIYALPFTRLPHPEYGKVEIPAFTMIRHSVTVHRGCFGGCAFCSIAAHQGKTIQSRSEQSIVAEVKKIAAEPHFKGVVSDLGGPTANMYKLGCKNENAHRRCRRLSCLVPETCSNLDVDQSTVIRLMRKIRAMDGIRQVFIASGVRADLALHDERYVDELVRHHVGGHLKTAPEHTDPDVLALMNKPSIDNYDAFCALFHDAARRADKEIYLVPYLIAGLPGSTLSSMVRVAEYLKANDIRPEQVQEFIPGPFELAGVMYHTGLDPMTGQPVYVAKGARERRLQKALLLYHDPNCYHDVKSALREAGREDLIGNGPHCLIPPYPPRKEMALLQTSRVKRLQKKQAKERQETEKRREEQRELDRPVIKPPQDRRDSRFSRQEEERPRQRTFARDKGGTGAGRMHREDRKKTDDTTGFREERRSGRSSDGRPHDARKSGQHSSRPTGPKKKMPPKGNRRNDQRDRGR